MPWSRAKALPPPDNTLFDACFRIQREACDAAGRHIPLIVENVRGAQKWVGRSRWNYGSFHLWGDVPALMPIAKAVKVPGLNWSDQSCRGQDFTGTALKRLRDRIKGIPHKPTGHWTNPADNGVKIGGDAMFGMEGPACFASKSPTRKAASAMIAKIPFPLAYYIGKVFSPCA